MDAAWDAFLADTVTPRFPDGLTVLDARGQWRDSEGLIGKEALQAARHPCAAGRRRDAPDRRGHGRVQAPVRPGVRAQGRVRRLRLVLLIPGARVRPAPVGRGAETHPRQTEYHCWRMALRERRPASAFTTKGRDLRMPRPLDGRHVALGVTGSIACHKAVDLASKLVQAGALVDVLMTESATRFATPLAFRSITPPARADRRLRPLVVRLDRARRRR